MNPARVLLIEDNPGDAELITIALDSTGEFSLEVCGSLSEGIERMAAGRPDLVLLDLGLPDSEGIDTFVQANRAAPGLPIVVLTGFEDDVLALQAVRLGAQDYLVKGVARSLLLRSIRYSIERKRTEEALVRDREALRLSQAQLAGAQRLAHVGSFLWDLTDNSVTWSDELLRIFNFDTLEGQPDFHSLLARVVPNDRPALQMTIQSSLEDGRPFEMEIRIGCPEGSVRYLDTRGEILTDDDGRPVKVLAVSQDITDRKRAEATLLEREHELRAARDQAVQASEFKSQFLANMSHEIRTPMNGVLGLTHLLLEEENDQEKRGYLLALRDSGQNLLAIINDILDFSKVEAGRLEVEWIELNTRELVERVVALFSAQAAQKGLTLVSEQAPDVPQWISGDPVRLKQILTNLLSNAVKFTDRGGVSVSVLMTDPEIIRFEVSDTGIGIDPAHHDRLMDPFSQADSSTTRRFGGTGLGIAICRQLVALMAGSFNYTSEPGVGSTFWFELPLHPMVPGGAGRAGAGEQKAGTRAPASKGQRVLIVEDNRINRLVAKAMLEKLGYQVDTAQTGLQAVESFERTRYSFILMDCLMPVMDGYEATEAIRRIEPPGQRTPIIALTALAMAGDREKCLEAGMDDYLSKPLTPDALATVLESAGVS